MRKPGVDILKIIAVAAVVAIHASFAYYFSVLKQSYTTVPAMIDQLWRFSVPLFVAVSGYGLMTGYGHGDFDFLRFLKRRVWRLLPWYLVVATLTIILVTFVWHESDALYHGAKLWRLYIFGQADYHLYFVPMIIQLYLLFPVLLWLFRRLPPKFLVVLAFFWQVGWYIFISQKTEFVTNNNGFWPDQEQYRNFASWIFYFVFGMYLTKTKSYPWLGFLLTIGGLALAMLSAANLLGRGMDIFVSTRFTRVPVLIYATGIIILGKYLIDNLRVNSLKKLGDYSYLVYLFHPLAIRAVLHLTGVY